MDLKLLVVLIKASLHLKQYHRDVLDEEGHPGELPQLIKAIDAVIYRATTPKRKRTVENWEPELDPDPNTSEPRWDVTNYDPDLDISELDPDLLDERQLPQETDDATNPSSDLYRG